MESSADSFAVISHAHQYDRESNGLVTQETLITMMPSW